MRNTYNIQPLIILALLLVACIAIQAFLSNPPLIKLHSAQPLAGQVAQSLQSGGKATALPAPGKDFTITGVHYFSGDTWAVVEFQPTKTHTLDGGWVVLQKKAGVFRVVLGPTSSLSSDYAIELPDDVTAYFYTTGVFH